MLYFTNNNCVHSTTKPKSIRIVKENFDSYDACDIDIGNTSLTTLKLNWFTTNSLTRYAKRKMKLLRNDTPILNQNQIHVIRFLLDKMNYLRDLYQNLYKTDNIEADK